MAEKPTMTAAEVKAKLRGRHPATQRMGTRTVPGPWACIEEWYGIDLLALAAVSHPQSGAKRGVSYPRVGYEVKISRSDLRHELLNPFKRARAVDFCNEFFLAVPKGLLKPEEVAFEEPEWFDDAAAWSRERCPNGCQSLTSRRRKGGYKVLADTFDPSDWRSVRYVTCPVCKGKGSIGPSRVEREAPTLWVPKDLGLVEVDGRGTHVRKAAPQRKDIELHIGAGELGALVRWVSARPDPRHAGVVEDARARGRAFTALANGRRDEHDRILAELAARAE